MISKSRQSDAMTSTSVKIQKQLHQLMLEHIIKNGYGMRGKSKWIVEAIQNLIELPNYVDFVDIADEATSLDEIISLRMPKSVFSQLEIALIEVRKKFPEMEAVKSKLVRASITQRLLRGTSVTEVKLTL
jgi:hypothetical protein